jgi:outer membrane protein assembly factor BamB
MPGDLVMTLRFAMGLVAITLAGAGSAVGAPSVVTLSPVSGHPGQAVTVKGTGFGDGEAIDIYVDTGDTLLLVSTSTGSFSRSVTIPASDGPGLHYVTAIGRRSGDAAQSAFTVTTPWDQFGYGVGHSNSNPYENSLTPSVVPSLGVLWSVANRANGATPAITGGRAYVSTAQGIQALSTSTGAVVWSAATSDYFYGSPALVGGTIYIGSGSGTVYALNASTGATIWTRPLASQSFYASPVVVGNLVYIATYAGKVYALNASTGATRWTYAISAHVDGSPTVVNGVLYIGSVNNSVYALNAKTGALLWSYATGGQVETTPAVVNNVVYVGSGDGKLYAIKAAGTSGSLLWSYTTGAAVYASPAVANGVVYIGSSDGNMYALNARTGALDWSLATGATVRTAAVAAGVVYFTAANDLVYAANASTGEVLGSAVTGESYFGGPAISDGVAYVTSNTGYTYAFAPQAGTDVVKPKSIAPKLSSLHPDLSLRVTP